MTPCSGLINISANTLKRRVGFKYPECRRIRARRVFIQAPVDHDLRGINRTKGVWEVAKSRPFDVFQHKERSFSVQFQKQKATLLVSTPAIEWPSASVVPLQCPRAFQTTFCFFCLHVLIQTAFSPVFVTDPVFRLDNNICDHSTKKRRIQAPRVST